MSEAKEFTEKTGIQLNTDIIEQVPVRKISVDSVDEKTGSAKYSIKTVMESQTVRYMEAPKVKSRCSDGEHIFRILNKNNYVFGCTKCPFARKVYPTTYRFDEQTGKLIHRETGRII